MSRTFATKSGSVESLKVSAGGAAGEGAPDALHGRVDRPLAFACRANSSASHRQAGSPRSDVTASMGRRPPFAARPSAARRASLQLVGQKAPRHWPTVAGSMRASQRSLVGDPVTGQKHDLARNAKACAVLRRAPAPSNSAPAQNQRLKGTAHPKPPAHISAGCSTATFRFETLASGCVAWALDPRQIMAASSRHAFRLACCSGLRCWPSPPPTP